MEAVADDSGVLSLSVIVDKEAQKSLQDWEITKMIVDLMREEGQVETLCQLVQALQPVEMLSQGDAESLAEELQQLRILLWPMSPPPPTKSCLSLLLSSGPEGL